MIVRETRIIHLYKCTICGEFAGNERSLDQCRDTPTSHPIWISEDLKKLGFEVTVWESPWWRKRGSRPYQIRYTALPFYSDGRTILSTRYVGDRCNSIVPLHTLCVSLCQDGHNNPWKFGDTGRSWFTVTWDDYLLLEEGNIDKLICAGLIPLPTKWERLKMNLQMPY